MIIIALTLLVLFRLESLIFTIPFLNSAVETLFPLIVNFPLLIVNKYYLSIAVIFFTSAKISSAILLTTCVISLVLFATLTLSCVTDSS